ncbi:unnamed protein product [Symbiodinium sp. CCMP2592]|nr:unnamed protein product [Symbiodinium sp. CCMP2592]
MAALVASSNSAISLDKLTAWWHRGPQLSVKSLKAYLCMLLCIELLGLSAPEPAVLSLPDALRRVRRHPYGPGDELGLMEGPGVAESPHLMPRLQYLFMPDLNDGTADAYNDLYSVLHLGSGDVCLFRKPEHDVRAHPEHMFFILFLMGATFVVPQLGDAFAQAWLWKFLVMSILAPYYLVAGFAKWRYAGWISVLTGTWMQRNLLNFPSFFPGFNAWAAHTPLVTALFSHGCMLVEFVGPLLVLSINVGKPCSKVAQWTLTVWSCFVLGFLAGAFVFLSPNFVRQVPLTILILHGLWCPDGSESQRPDAQDARPLAYHCRVILAMLLLSSWFAVQVWSDISHLTGATPQFSKHDPGWPIGEFSMFVILRSVSRDSCVLWPLREEVAGHLVRQEERHVSMEKLHKSCACCSLEVRPSAALATQASKPDASVQGFVNMNLFKTFPGRRCILVAHKGRLVYEHYAPGADAFEQIELDSAAKTVSALLIGVLVTQGRLDIDRPLAEYKVKPFAYWGDRGEYWPLITARHLMTHTSGLGKGPPGVKFEYNSGEHIQHLSALIRVLTSEHYASPVDWAEDQFAKPLGLPGLFDHDGLDGDISIGGGQLMSCPQLARIGQLLMNRGAWPISSAPAWPLDWLPWASNKTSVFQLVSKDYIREMTRPSFPQVVSTYGFLVWLNHATSPEDSSCCMCTCGACFGINGPPIFGVNEEAWFATGYLTRYLIMLPERDAFVVSLGMDLTGSTSCSVTWSWFSITYDDSFGALLHYLVLEAALPLPASTTTLTSTTTTRTLTSTTQTLTTYTTTSGTTVLQTTTTSLTSAAHGNWPLDWLWPTTSTTTAGWWPLAFFDGGLKNANSTTTTTTFDLSTVIYNHGTKSNVSHVRRSKRHKKKEHEVDKGYMGGSCTCSCPVDQDFGRCYPLPNDMVFGKWSHGQEACDVFGSGYLLSERSCPNVGVVQPCTSNSWAIGGGTHDVCGRSFWTEDMGLNCSQLTFCDSSHGQPIFVDTRRLATCSCNVVRWKCDYDYEACDGNDTYYPPGSAELAQRLLQHWSAPQPHAKGWFSFSLTSVTGSLALAVALGILVAIGVRRRRNDLGDYRPL